MTTKVERMADHVESIGAWWDVKIVHYSGAGRAFPHARRVMIRPVKGVSTYFAALHELGHVLARGRSARKLEAEANCWAWALQQAIRPPTPGVRKMIANCLASYLAAGRRNHGTRQSMVEPPADHVFWKLLRKEDPQ